MTTADSKDAWTAWRSGAVGLAMLSLAATLGLPRVLASQEEETAEPINLVVQVVDDLWLPLNDAAVTVSAQTRRAETYRASTDGNGYARFSIPPNVRYSVKVTLWGYKEERIRAIRAWGNQTAYAQVKLRE